MEIPKPISLPPIRKVWDYAEWSSADIGDFTSFYMRDVGRMLSLLEYFQSLAKEAVEFDYCDSPPYAKLADEIVRLTAGDDYTGTGESYLRCDDCNIHHLERVEHEANEVDWNSTSGVQGYMVWRCTLCGDYWGQRYQSDPGTGSDDRWHRFGQVNPETIVRHY